MSDNLRRYRAIQNALTQCYPGQPPERVARHLRTLAALISGIVGSKSTHLPKIAAHVPDGTKPESRGKRFARWVRNDKITAEVYFVPYATVLLAQLASQTLRAHYGWQCRGPWVCGVDDARRLQRARPAAGMAGPQGQEGAFSRGPAYRLSQTGVPTDPAGGVGGVAGRWRFDGNTLQHTVQDYHWSYVVRTGSHILVQWDGERFRCDTVAACIKPGTLVELTEVRVTEAAYGPVMLLCCWAKGYKEPLHLLTNLASADEACRLYAKRFRIETFFSDQKSRGFHLHKSHLLDPMRLSRLLTAACLAYIWIIYLGALCEHDGWISMVHRGDRCDLSLFQLGLRLLEYLLNEDRAIPVAFYVTIYA